MEISSLFDGAAAQSDFLRMSQLPSGQLFEGVSSSMSSMSSSFGSLALIVVGVIMIFLGMRRLRQYRRSSPVVAVTATTNQLEMQTQTAVRSLINSMNAPASVETSSRLRCMMQKMAKFASAFSPAQVLRKVFVLVKAVIAFIIRIIRGVIRVIGVTIRYAKAKMMRSKDTGLTGGFVQTCKYQFSDVGDLKSIMNNFNLQMADISSAYPDAQPYVQATMDMFSRLDTNVRLA